MWGAAMTAMAWFLILIVALGATVFRSRHWAEAFREIAFWEVERRGFANRKWSSTDDEAICLLVGMEPLSPDGPETTLGGLVLSTFSILSGSADVRSLASLVVEKREALLGEALERQLRRVARFFTVRWAARAWVAQKWLSSLGVAIRGVAWLLPRSINEVAAIVKEYSTKLGVVAVFVGSLYWVLTKDTGEHAVSAPDVVGFLTKLVVPGLIVWAIGVLLFRILVAFAGPPSGWSKRAAVVVLLTGSISTGTALAMYFAGKWLAPRALKWLDQVDPNNPATLRIMAGVFSAGFVWMAWKLAIRSFDRTRLMSHRVGDLAASGMLAVISIPLVAIAAMGAVPAPFRTMMFAAIAVAIVLSFVGSGFGVCEWIDRYKTLARGGVNVPRWGFSWKAVGAWIASMALLFVQAALPIKVQNSLVGLALIVPPMLAMLGTIPLIVVCVLFVRRVNSYFERHMTVQWAELGECGPTNRVAADGEERPRSASSLSAAASR
jgi:hypothetical protein